MITTTHIQRMLDAAKVLAEDSHGNTGEVHQKALERAVNLCRHAAAELEDELLLDRDGWPVV